MVIISDAAKATLRVALQRGGVEPGQALRVTPGMDGFDLEVDAPSSTDRIISCNGVPVLIIDQVLDNEIKHVLVDMNDAGQGLEVTFRPFPGMPNDSCLRFGEDAW